MVPKRKGLCQLLIVGNASWHKAAVELASLPTGVFAGLLARLQRIERLWLRLKADWFWDFIAHTPTKLTDRLCTALKASIDEPAKTASLYSIRK